MGQLEGKTAVVTGGSSGIGLATAVRLADEGAYVFVTGRREAELEAAVKTIGADRATAVAGDIANLEDLDRLYEAVRARGQGLDVLVANAAIGSFMTLEQTTEEHFDQTFAVNARGTLFTVQKALPVLNDGASIVMVGSPTRSRRPIMPNPLVGNRGSPWCRPVPLSRTWMTSRPAAARILTCTAEAERACLRTLVRPS
ncbi:SDR family NAD(P)-dependent oxidoreductase [Streptomyces xiamenensis]|uniref:SDR family NAD(P)-dependent oxidoreductase n=1 Tax=Streptomyces xiamenensis TaxID=408015 RepID=UPI003D72CED6